MSRDPEAERYELQVQRERHDELGRALYERRRPDAPKAWSELTEDERTAWILIAVDQQSNAAVRQSLALARQMTGEPEVLLELESTLGPNPLSPDDPPNVHRLPVDTSERGEREAEAVGSELANDPELRRGVRKLLGQMQALSDSQDAAEPHCLLVTDPQTSKSWVIGGFHNRLHARIAIPLIEARYRQADPEFLFTYTPLMFEAPPWDTQ